MKRVVGNNKPIVTYEMTMNEFLDKLGIDAEFAYHVSTVGDVVKVYVHE